MYRVLAIRVGRVGDMVMITPALRAIINMHPDADVQLLTSPEGRHVLHGFDPRLTDPLVYDRRGPGHALRRRRLMRKLAAGRYRYIYCFETNPRYRALLHGVPGEKLILGPTEQVVPFPERCLRLVGVQPSPSTWVSLPLSATGCAGARAMLASAGIRDDDFVIGVHPSFSALHKLNLRSRKVRRNKHWPLASFARAALLLVDRAAHQGVKLRVICDLLPQERPLGLEFVERSNGVVTLFTEPPDFERYKATIARMNLLITPDTGPMHIAAALGTPLIALFSGRDPRDCGPYTDPARYTVLRAEETARPELGLSALSPDVVFAAATMFLPDAG
jgi:ADP-heptose:LPS heptosyltransferase